MIVVLAGGVGAARFLQGVVQVVPQENVTVIANTGDDREFYGLHVSPDVDIVLYTLAHLVDEKQGWGIQGDTYHTMKQLTAYGYEDWFALGDRDLATHIHRTNLLRQGKTLSEITEQMREKLGLSLRVIPMTNDQVATHVQTPDGLIHFEEYFVKRRCNDEVQGITFVGAETASPAPGVLEAIRDAEAVLLAPSNPIVSIGSILSIPGTREAVRQTKGKVVAVSPIVGGATIKGPADKMMRGLGMEVSAAGVAQSYQDFLDTMVIDTQDEGLAPAIEQAGIQCIVTNTIMRDLDAKTELARTVLRAAGVL